MKKYIYILINFFLINNFFYKIYLNIHKKIKFIGIQNFNPIPAKKKLTLSLLKLMIIIFQKKQHL